MGRKTRRTRRKPVACKDSTTARERLPLPVVLYPGHYGAFFGFQQDVGAPIALCSCAREAVENYLALRLSEPIPSNADPARMFVLDCMYFPRALVVGLMRGDAPCDQRIISHIAFEHRLCHECNAAVPGYRYCHEMYGGTFKQNFGWYINKQAFEFGIEPITHRFLPDVSPQEILPLLEPSPSVAWNRSRELSADDPEEARRLWNEAESQSRQLWSVIEDEVRQRFGHRKIGEGWTSETMLYYIVRSLFPDITILRHHRPPFLDGLELDVFLKEPAVGLEYQGVQHFKPVAHWGGEEGLRKVKERDQRKRQLCRAAGVHLVYFRYDEDLSENLVLDRLQGLVKHG